MLWFVMLSCAGLYRPRLCGTAVGWICGTTEPEIFENTACLGEHVKPSSRGLSNALGGFG
jgi:hypothetical protein